MSDIQFQQVTHGGDIAPDFIKRQLYREFSAPVEISIYVSLNFKSDIPFILNQFNSDTSGVLTVTSPNTFVLSNNELILDGYINDRISPFDVVSRQISVNASGSIKAVKELYTKLEKFINTRETYVHWWYKTAHGIDSIRFTVEDNKVFRPEHYPFISGASDYTERFLASPATILILLGDPGTGKTSLIRHILRTSGKEAYVTYDDQVMHDDCLYTDFLSTSSVKFLVLEDADLILADRQRDGNRVMSKILNAADGLVSFSDKKIIFTANIRDINKIDEALMRPGRCFDVINFRSLQEQEIAKVCEVNKITIKNPKPEMSLAEIFN